ncbi:MAG: sugar ABC transporter substrate-binding protein [Dehalococcoidales bacterium]|nr:sugar ABC transporter substrate-binding protein [Dehalococcoidales bacterium]
MSAKQSIRRLTRRDFVKLGTTALTFSLVSACAPAVPAPASPAPAQGGAQPPAQKGGAKISIAINQSPWLPGFQRLAELYEKQTANKIELNVFPFAGLLEKTMNAAVAGSKEFDIVNMNEYWYGTFYAGGYITPIKEIDPTYKPDPQIIEYGYCTRWDPAKKYSSKDGELYGVPINGNIQIYYYRKDIFDKIGMKEPQTFDDVIAAAQKGGNPSASFYGYCNRAHKEGIWWDILPFFRGFGGNIFLNEPEDYTVACNSPECLKGLNLYLELAKYAPPNVADMSQAEQIALFTSDKLLQTIMVCAAFPDMDNVEKSKIVDKVEYTVVPKPAGGKNAPAMGIWVMGVPKAIDISQKKYALDFLKWATTKEAQLEYQKFGAIPVRQDVYESELANDRKYRYMKAMAKSTPFISPSPRMAEAPKVQEAMSLRLNQAVIGQLKPQEALDTLADDIYKIVSAAGYKTGKIK